MVEGIVLYLLTSVVLFWIYYQESLEENCRYSMDDYREISKKTSLWRRVLKENQVAWRIFVHDFFKLHCPWSWKVAVWYRVQAAHGALLRSAHEKGWTAEDCHNAANYAQIARDCFCSRKRFWAKHVFLILACPVSFTLLVVFAAIVSVWAAFVTGLSTVRRIFGLQRIPV